MPNAYLYLRVSSDEQADSGLGIAAQRAACIRYCNNNNLALLGIYADEGVSGSTQLAERPQLAQLINKLKAGDVVVYLNRARLGRGVEVCMTIDAAIRAHKARHVSTAGEGTNGYLLRHVCNASKRRSRGVGAQPHTPTHTRRLSRAT